VDATHVAFSAPAEHIGEAKPLSVMIRQRSDLKVATGNWRWAPDKQYPPIENVLKSPFWSAEAYAPARARLCRPTPVIGLRGGADFVTVTTGGAAVTKEADGAQLGSTEVCLPSRPAP
jgi:hypothetical protein